MIHLKHFSNLQTQFAWNLSNVITVKTKEQKVKFLTSYDINSEARKCHGDSYDFTTPIDSFQILQAWFPEFSMRHTNHTK